MIKITVEPSIGAGVEGFPGWALATMLSRNMAPRISVRFILSN